MLFTPVHHIMEAARKEITIKLIVLFLLFFYFSAKGQSSKKNIQPDRKTEWLVARLLNEKSDGVQIRGNPQQVSSPYGDAVHFNGVSDAVFLQEMPLKSWKEFTVEMIFCPDSLSPFEQRILHIGEVSDDRMLIEIRAVNNGWYLDGFVASKENNKALINEQLTHPLGHWYHVALVVSPERMTTFVNGKVELSEPFSFLPLESGRTSIGVRQNERSWFKGSIYKIRITPKQLQPGEFMNY